MIQVTTAAKVLAQLRSRQAVKRHLQAYGLKVSHFSAREITSWAMVYLDDNSAELIPAAMARAEAMIARGDFGKKAKASLARQVLNSTKGEKL